MSEIEDLEAYETLPTPVDNAKQAAGKRYFLKTKHFRNARAQFGALKKAALEPRFPTREPSMPKFKCLTED